MLTALTVLSVLAASASAQYSYAVDIMQSGSASSFSCLRSNGYATVFTRAYKPDGSGIIDPNAVNNIVTASKNGLGVEAYVTPRPIGSKNATIQIDEAINNLVYGGITLRSLWLQVTSPVNWNSNQGVNVNFINAALQRIRSRGIRPGVYTNSYDWQQITNGASNTGSDVMLWYWNVYGQGAGGESPANFNDFRAFGPFRSASVKQFGQNEAICSFTANRNVYSNSGTKSVNNEKSDKIVVGAIGL